MGAEVSHYPWDQIDLLGVKICIELAMACVETDRAKRPSTKAIIDELQKLDVQIMNMSREKVLTFICTPDFVMRFFNSCYEK